MGSSPRQCDTWIIPQIWNTKMTDWYCRHLLYAMLNCSKIAVQCVEPGTVKRKNNADAWNGLQYNQTQSQTSISGLPIARR